jgi:hypothetical protein
MSVNWILENHFFIIVHKREYTKRKIVVRESVWNRLGLSACQSRQSKNIFFAKTSLPKNGDSYITLQPSTS